MMKFWAKPANDTIEQFGAVAAYQQPWFDAVASYGRKRKRIEVKSKDGKVLAALTYTLERRHKILMFGSTPSWSHINEPLIDASLNDDQRVVVLRRLVRKLPRSASLKFICNPAEKECERNVLIAAFKAAGFEHGHQVTYREKPSDPDVMSPDNVNGFDRKRRGNIRRAEKNVEFSEDLDANEFMAFYGANLRAAGMKPYSPLHIAQKLVATGQALDLTNRFFTNGNGERVRAKQVVVFAAREKSGIEGNKKAPLVAAIACLFDSKYCYYWMTTRRTSSDNKYDDTVKALIVRARARARDIGVTFDADGVSTAGTKEFYEKLHFPHKLERDIFIRYNPAVSFLYKHRPEINMIRNRFRKPRTALAL